MSTWQEQRQVIRGCVILLSIIICAFLWLSVASFDPLDWPNPHVYPHPTPAHNACGAAGAWVAQHLREYFGLGVYGVVGGMTLAIAVLARQGKLTSMWQRVLGIALIIAVFSTAAHIFTASNPHIWCESRGGVLGYFLANSLQRSVKWMTIPVLCYALLVGLLFTSEGLMLRIPRFLRQQREQSEATKPTRSQMVTSVATPFGRFLDRFRQVVTTVVGGRIPALVGIGGGASSRSKSASSTGSTSDKASKSRRNATPSDEEEKKESATVVAEPDEELDETTPLVDDDEIDEDFDEEEEYDDEEDEDDYDDEDDEDYDDEEEEDEEEAAEVEEADAEIEKDEPVVPEQPIVVKFAAPPVKSTVPVVPPKPYPVELKEWELPSIQILKEPEYNFSDQQEAQVREKAQLLKQTLMEYKVDCNVTQIDSGPVITMYELHVAPGVKVSQISSLSNDIARALKAPSVRVVAPIPGKDTIGIEVPNLNKEVVRVRELMTSTANNLSKMALPLFLGKDASGSPLVSDLAGMPHMLIAGTTGSGKSVCINSIIMSILMTQRPDMVKLILVDPKMVEMAMFREVPHLMCPIVTEIERAEKILEWATVKMDERYALLAEAQVRNIAAYNRLTKEEKQERFNPATEEEATQIPSHLPYIVIIIDELADLMMMSAKEVENYLVRLAQKSRAVGIHLIVATQRPEAKVVTGLIKGNLPCRIAFRVASRIDSRIVLDQNGAEVLMGQGDMLYLPPGSSKLVRAQGTYIDDGELKSVIGFLKERAEPEFHPELMQLRNAPLNADGPRDELFNQAVEIVLQTKRGSVSLLQRRLTIGYSRASRLIEEMAAAGIVGQYKGSQAREVAITPEQWEQMKAAQATAAEVAPAVSYDRSPWDDDDEDDEL